VVTPLSFPAGVLESGDELTVRDLHAHVVQRVEKDLDQALRPELEGVANGRLLLKGDPPRAPGRERFLPGISAQNPL
jgi:hypothetical protein